MLKKHSCHKPVQAKVKSATLSIVLAALMFFAVGTASPHPYKFQQQRASLVLLARVLQVIQGHTAGLCQLVAAQRNQFEFNAYENPTKLTLDESWKTNLS